jgi:hypothetical protein
MNRVIAVVACGLTVAACASGGSSFMPNLFSKPQPTPVKVQFQSQPPGAQAVTSTGASCKTPCELDMDPSKEFSVTFTLAGYQQQLVPVALRAPEGLSAEEAEQQKAFDPNPVVATLEAAAKKKVPPPKKPAPKPAAAAAAPKPAAPAAAAPKPATAPRPASPPVSPPPGGDSPWPPLPQ